MVLIATTAIWKITKRLDHVIDYTTDKDKTLNERYNEFHAINEYSNLDYIDEKQCFISTLNCSEESAYEEMMITKKTFNKKKGILGYHAFQSFAEGEVTAEQAHEIGVKLAEEIWGDRFEVIISTHQNTKHIHNHFVINSVSFADGKKYYDNHSSYARIREISDRLCEEYNLNVLEEKSCRKSKINYNNYKKCYIKKDNYHTRALDDVNLAIDKSKSIREFINNMMALDYTIYLRYDKITIRKKGYKQNIRIERCFGDDYTLENLKNRFEENYKNNYKKNQQPKNILKRKKGLYNLYLYYCFLLKNFKSKKLKIIPAELLDDVKKLEDISEQTKLLANNKIETKEQFFLFVKNKNNELNTLLGNREKLWYQYKVATNKDIIKNEINEITKRINKLRSTLKLCDNIEQRCDRIENVVLKFEMNERREKKYELK